MYLLIKEWVDPGHAINSAAHAGMLACKKWQNESEMIEYFKGLIKKVTCEVSLVLFDEAKTIGYDYIAVTERAFDNEEIALIFKPRKKWHKFFKYLKLYK